MDDDQLLLMDESNGYYYDKDDIYEADIHVSIGTLYMEEFDMCSSTSSITHAMTHFEQAVRLYDMSGDSDVDRSTNMALAKYNLFLLHLRNGNYRMAVRRYNEFIDLFRKIDAYTTDEDIYESFNDPTQFTEQITSQQHRAKRNHEQYHLSKQRQTTLIKWDASTTKATSKTGNASAKDSKHEVESAMLSEEQPSIYVDLQHFLTQNQSAKDEL